MGGDIEKLHGPRHIALAIWALCVAVLLGPALLVWIVRGVGYAAHCAPGPDMCNGVALGGGLRDTLALAWAVGTNTFFLILLSMIATVACFFARRPLLGALCLLLLPILALVLPMLAVFVSKYDGCEISPDGIGDCTLWGARMGMSFHTAASVPDIVFGFVPYSFALALMLGLLGWFIARPREIVPQHATARMRRFD